MASLNEIKSRIGSVKSTLKITSAMKMVASSKLRRAQSSIEGMLPYQESLQETLGELLKSVSLNGEYAAVRPLRRVALVCFASNSSLCGGFNSNVIKEVRSRVSDLAGEGVSVSIYAIGRKMAEACRLLANSGSVSSPVSVELIPADYTELSAKPTYEAAARLAEELVEGFLAERFDAVEMIHNHFVTTASQKVVNDRYLPLVQESEAGEEKMDVGFENEYIIEPGKQELLSALLPKVLKLKVFTTLLDSSAAEHAARTVAMQAASDNAEDILQELSLEYNKSRQQKITSEILDIIGGASC